MSIKEELFHFTQTLSQNEKRNFTTAVKRKKEEKKNYFILYQAFLSRNEFCDEKLKKIYKKEPSTRECSDLFDRLLQSIRTSSKVRTPQIEIREKLQDAEILYRRDLYEKSFKVLEKTKREAYKIEDYPVILDIIDKQRYVQRYLKVPKQRKLQDECDDILKILKVKNELDVLWESYVLMINGKGNQKKNNITVLNKEISSLSEKTIVSFKSSTLKIRYYFLLANLNENQGNIEEGIHFNKLVFEQYYENEEFKKANLEIYSNHLQGYFNSMVRLGKTDIVDEKLIKEFKSRLENDVNKSASSFENYFLFMCVYHLNMGHLEIFKNLIPHIKSGLDRFQDKLKIGYQRVFISNIISYYFIVADFSNCKVWLNRQIAQKNTTIEYNAMLRLFDFIISLELESDFIQSRRRIETFLKTKNYSDPFVVETKQFVIEYDRAYPNDKKKLINNYVGKLNSYEKPPVFFDEIEFWCHSKINGKSIRQNYLDSR